ncbi:MAG: fused MFS/spermidine synthase [bacterium]|nr:fused MFS/spermidine synthase [bacterium]
MFFQKPPKFILEIVVFLSGATVMAFELVGSRMLAPCLGTSLYVWTAIIGVILASLSFGYWLGGRIADKQPRAEDLSLVILLAALCILISMRLAQFILPAFVLFKSYIEVSAILASFLLFTPASILLGIVSPYTVKLKMKNIDSSATTVGNLYAISTVGSICGTFATGFFLLPFFGTKSILLILVSVLIVAAVLIFPWRFKNNKILLTLILMVISFQFFNSALNFSNNTILILNKDTKYNRIQIRQGVDRVNGRPVLSLSLDPFTSQSAMFLDGDDYVSEYLKFFDLAEYFYPNFKRTLLLGGAAFIYPKAFLNNFPQATIDVVEIDPAMFEIAKEYFHLTEDPKLRVVHEDGRTFLNRAEEKYDVIFGDTFNSALSLPFQLTTREAIGKQYDLLNENGVVFVNMISFLLPKKSKFLNAEIKTYQAVFPQVYLFSVPSRTAKLQNIILVALKSNKKNDLQSNDPRFKELLASSFEISIDKNVIVLTDDFAPVEYYARELAREY